MPEWHKAGAPKKSSGPGLTARAAIGAVRERIGEFCNDRCRIALLRTEQDTKISSRLQIFHAEKQQVMCGALNSWRGAGRPLLKVKSSRNNVRKRSSLQQKIPYKSSEFLELRLYPCVTSLPLRYVSTPALRLYHRVTSLPPRYGTTGSSPLLISVFMSTFAPWWHSANTARAVPCSVCAVSGQPIGRLRTARTLPGSICLGV